MNQQQCFDCLKSVLENIITNDYILLDVPYFSNVGDVLIWQSALDILDTLPQKCLYSTSKDTYCKPNIDDRVIIVFMGGGNFGDLWSNHHEFRHRVMIDFPRNPIVQLPQSICFKKDSNIDQDAYFYSRHMGPVYLFFREEKSFNIAREKYKNAKLYLVPDMVLSFDVLNYIKSRRIHLKKNKIKPLFVQRNDCEKKINLNVAIVPSNADIMDWPCMGKNVWQFKIYLIIQRFLKFFFFSSKIRYLFADFFYKRILRHVYLKSGIQFISQYNSIYSTRLHTAILAWLLNKTVYLFDNSYGKNSQVYKKWLEDQSNIILMD